MQKYSDKLKDPRWQKKRLTILKRDKWTCQYCGDTRNTLVVHHKDYLPNTEPWDYPNDILITLCEDCHEQERINRDIFESSIKRVMRLKFRAFNLFIINDGFESLDLNNEYDLYTLSEIIRWLCTDTEIQQELFRRFELEVESFKKILPP